MEWLNWLLSTEQFTPRAHCGVGWTPWLIGASRLANLTIALCYFAIPLELRRLWRDQHPLPRWILPIYAAFIMGCGMTHLTQVAAFMWPAYRFFTIVIEMPTAVISVAAVMASPFAWHGRKRTRSGGPPLWTGT